MLVGYIFCFFWGLFFITDFPAPDVWLFLLFDIQSFHLDQITITKHSSNELSSSKTNKHTQKSYNISDKFQPPLLAFKSPCNLFSNSFTTLSNWLFDFLLSAWGNKWLFADYFGLPPICFFSPSILPSSPLIYFCQNATTTCANLLFRIPLNP